jgi:hypothetical protein
VGPRASLDRCGKISLPLGFDPWTVQPIASCCTSSATWPTHLLCTVLILINLHTLLKRNNVSNNLHFCHIFTSITVPTIKEKQCITTEDFSFKACYTYKAGKQTARTFNSSCNYSDCKLCCMYVLIPHLPSMYIFMASHMFRSSNISMTSLSLPNFL